MSKKLRHLDLLPSAFSWYRKVYERRVPSNKAVWLQAERELRDFMIRQHEPDFPYFFSVEQANKALAFYRLWPHVKGELAGQSFEPAEWQEAFFASVSGWRLKSDHKVVRNLRILLQVGRKTGKTLMGSLMMLRYLLASPAGSGELYSVSATENQARLSVDTAKQMIASLYTREPEHPMLTRIRTYSWGVEARRVDNVARTWKPLSSKAVSAEGVNCAACLIDEAAIMGERYRPLISSVLESGRGRKSPISIWLTTAQNVHSSAYLDLLRVHQEGLEGGDVDDRLFGLTFQADRKPRESDDELFNRLAEDKDLWKAALPNLGSANYIEHLERDIKDAKLSPGMRGAVLLKSFCVFVNAADARFLDLEQWDQCAGEVVKEGDLFIGVDLGATGDLTAVCRWWRNSNRQASVEVDCFCPAGAISKVSAETRAVLSAAVDANELTVMGDKTLDMDMFINHLIAMCKSEGARLVAVDPWRSAALAEACENAGIEVLAVKQGTWLTQPIFRLEELVVSGKLRHGENKLLRWQVANSFRQEKAGRVLITKGDYEKKIDAVLALVLACQGAAAGASRTSGFEVVEYRDEKADDVVNIDNSAADPFAIEGDPFLR